MAREVAALTHGAPVESRIEEERFPEDAGDGEEAPFAARSELARHLRPSIFPTQRAAIVQCAIEEHAPDDLVDALRTLGDETFHTPNEVWRALGGETEPPAGHAEHVRFPLRFDWRHRIASAIFGVTPGNAFVELLPDPNGGTLHASFGFWQLKTPLRNVAEIERSGSYSTIKTIGPARLSLSDRGLTFAGNDAEGVCIRFADPVHAIEPLGLVLHPALTVTVDDPDGFVAALERMRGY
jgi:hypothetical protein